MLVGTAVVVVGACVVAGTIVVVVVSVLLLHAEATSSAATTTSYFFTIPVCHPTPQGGGVRYEPPRCRYAQSLGRSLWQWRASRWTTPFGKVVTWKRVRSICWCNRNCPSPVLRVRHLKCD